MRGSSFVLPSVSYRLTVLAALLPCAWLRPFAGARGLALAEEPPILFASRELPISGVDDGREDPIERAQSGRLLVRQPDGYVRVLVDAGAAGAPVDVMDPDVSFDAIRAVFAGYSEAESAWRIYEVSIDGAELRKVTRSDRQVDLARYGAAASRFQGYDDVNPCYLPDGRICFVSTRYPGVAPEGRVRGTNLYVVNADGSGLHRITTERFGADTPAVDPSTGRVAYARWWRTPRFDLDAANNTPNPIPPGSPRYGQVGVNSNSRDSLRDVVVQGISESRFPGVNHWFLASVNPDGTDLAMLSGFRIDRELTQAYRPSFLPDGSVLALFIQETPFIGYPRASGLRRFQRGPGAPESLGGPQAFPSHRNNSFRFVYASAASLPDGRYLVTAASIVNLDYDLYIQENDQEPTPLLTIPRSRELDAVPIVPRPLPPVLSDTATRSLVEEAPRSVEEAAAQGGTFVFKSENIHFNAPVDVPVASAPPIGKRLAIEFFTSPQRAGATRPDPPLLIRREEIGPDGKIEVELPAGTPLFEVLRRPDGAIPVGRDGQIFHVGGMNFNRAGQTARCVGCHAGHSMMAVPEDASWTNLAPSARASANTLLSGVINRTVSMRPQALIDRQTQTAWTAGGIKPPQAVVELRWTVPIRAREVVVYGTSRRVGTPEEMDDQVIRAFTVTTFFDGQVGQDVTVTREVRPEGTRLVLDADDLFDILTVTIKGEDVSGMVSGVPSPALSEIEVIAQAAGDFAPMVSFMRGDTDCDANVNITDAISLLNNLFLEGPRLCCGSAADVNLDARLDLTDGIIIASYLFLGRGPLPDPFPDCGRVPEGPFVCDEEACP